MSASITYITEHSDYNCPKFNGHRFCQKSRILFQIRGNFYLVYGNSCMFPENAESVEMFINSILERSDGENPRESVYYRDVSHKFRALKTLDDKAEFILNKKLQEVHYVYSGNGNGHHYYLSSVQNALDVIDYQKNLLDSVREIISILKKEESNEDLIDKAKYLYRLNYIEVEEKQIIHTLEKAIKKIRKHESEI